MENVYESKDRQVVPFLFVQKCVVYKGSFVRNGEMIFLFSPFDESSNLVNLFLTRKAPLVQPKDLLDAVETYKNIVFGMKNK
jgi:hypothetical protein